MDFTMNQYNEVQTRFLTDDERLILSNEKEMPLVIEAKEQKSLSFLIQWLANNAEAVIHDMAQYGAVLLRGFEIQSDEDFEKVILSIPSFRGISDAFMAENGRVPVDKLKYVLHTNAVYKTGGTLYLGGFHTENYYSPDVPGYICFYCKAPSALGGETGLINTEKVYRALSEPLKKKLEKQSYFVAKWLVSEVAQRYNISKDKVEKIAQFFKLPIVGEGEDRFILMYKPSVFKHPLTHEKALQINLFELPKLNAALRKCFLNAYTGKTWFWHRFFWRLPNSVFNFIEFTAVMVIAFCHSPRNSFSIIKNKIATYWANKKVHSFNTQKVGTSFSQAEVEALAQTMREQYSSCLWKKGDVLLIDNKKVMHAGMPGKGDRVIRAMIGNPIAMDYFSNEIGCIDAHEQSLETIGYYMNLGKIPASKVQSNVLRHSEQTCAQENI